MPEASRVLRVRSHASLRGVDRSSLVSWCRANRRVSCRISAVDVFRPKLPGDLKRFDSHVVPPCHFVSAAMQLAVMGVAKRNGKIVAHFSSQCSWLRKTEVVRLRRSGAAQQTWLRGDVPEMVFVTDALELWESDRRGTAQLSGCSC